MYGRRWDILLAWAALGAFLTVSFQVTAKTVRDTLFLSNFPVTDLPLMVAASAVLSLLLAFLLSRMLSEKGPARVTPRLFFLSGVLLWGEWVLVGHNARLVAVILYLHLSGLGFALVSAYWSLVGERLDPRKARRQLSWITSSGTFGGAIGTLGVVYLTGIEPNNLLILLGGAHLGCALICRQLGREAESLGRRHEPLRISSMEALRSMRYARQLAALVLLSALTAGLLDFAFKAATSERLPSGEELLRFFTFFHVSTSLLTFGVQSLFSRVSLERFGLAPTLGILPLTQFLTSSVGFAGPSLVTTSVARGSDMVVRNSLFRSAYELFYTPISERRKRAVKALIDVGAERCGDLLSGVLIQVVLLCGLAGLRFALAGAVVTSLLSLGLSVRLRGGYARALEQGLMSRVLALDLREIPDLLTRQLVTSYLGQAAKPPSGELLSARDTNRQYAWTDNTDADGLFSRDPAVVKLALAGTTLDNDAMVLRAIRLVAWDDVCDQAARALVGNAERTIPHVVRALMDQETDFTIRRRLPGILADMGTSEAVTALCAGLRDKRFEVRYRCGLALSKVSRRISLSEACRKGLLEAAEREIVAGRSRWPAYRLLDAPGEDEVEGQGRHAEDLGLAHVFLLLSLALPDRSIKAAYRAMLADDPGLRWTGVEYLETVLPPQLFQTLRPLLELEQPRRERKRSKEQLALELNESQVLWGDRKPTLDKE